MKRLALLISAAAFAMSFNACEKHTVAELPEHYQHKGQAHPAAAAGEAHGEKAPAEPAKPAH